jgi:hypothetical protein
VDVAIDLNAADAQQGTRRPPARRVVRYREIARRHSTTAIKVMGQSRRHHGDLTAARRVPTRYLEDVLQRRRTRPRERLFDRLADVTIAADFGLTGVAEDLKDEVTIHIEN